MYCLAGIVLMAGVVMLTSAKNEGTRDDVIEVQSGETNKANGSRTRHLLQLMLER